MVNAALPPARGLEKIPQIGYLAPLIFLRMDCPRRMIAKRTQGYLFA
jgi:hypothetical protein